MADKEFIPRPDTVGVRRTTLDALKQQVALERKNTRALQTKLDDELSIARRATEETAKARQEREEYRRVLAAAIANEKNSAKSATQIQAEFALAKQELQDALVTKGEAQGQAGKLQEWLESAALDHAKVLQRVRDEAHTERAHHQRELAALIQDKGRAEGRVRELSSMLHRELVPSARALRFRGGVAFGAAGLCLLTALVFLPPFLMVVFGARGSTQMQMAIGLSAWQLLFLELLLFGLSLGLCTLGIRDFRACERPQEKLGETATSPG